MQPPPKCFFFNMHIWYKIMSLLAMPTSPKSTDFTIHVYWRDDTGWVKRYCMNGKHHMVYSQVTKSAQRSFFFFFLLVSAVCGNQRQPQPNVSILIFTGYFSSSSSSSGKLAVRCGRVLAQVSFGFTSTRWVQKWVTDTSSKGPECLYESRFVQNVHYVFFSPKWCL